MVNRRSLPAGAVVQAAAGSRAAQPARPSAFAARAEDMADPPQPRPAHDRARQAMVGRGTIRPV